MKTSRHRPPAARRKKESGLSLVLVLFAVLSLSVLIVLFFSLATNDRSSTSAYTNGMKAEELATNGLELVISDLRKQIVDHSDADTPTGTAGPVIYKLKPGERQYIKPIFSASDSYGNLVAISKAGKSVYPDGNLAGSSDPTTTKSRNGRSFSIDRWAKPALAKEFGDPNASSPVPTWIYMGRSGPITSPTVSTMSKTDDPNYAIGRIAFAIYDISGLIDMNVAGYPRSLNAKDAEMKGSVALAKLDADDGGYPIVLSGTQIDNLIAFRNATSGTNYIAHLQNTSAHQGFEKTVPGDNRFLSRQELIRFATRNGFSNKLQLMTVFSREKNAPSYGPESGQSALTVNPSINVNLATARHNSGRLLFEQRFPLEKLELFNSPDQLSNAQKVKDLKAFFGLSYDSGSRTFTYTESKSGKIKTLSDLASEDYRRPNFFETLKAVIYQGTIGQSAGTTATVTDDPDQDAHIMQIGANIIDQYDTDDLDPADSQKKRRIPVPTTIVFGGKTLYGVEDLPYVNKITILGEPISGITGNVGLMKVGKENASLKTDTYSFIAGAELWNPNFQSLPDSPLHDPKIRVKMNGGTKITLYATTNAVDSSTSGGKGDATPPLSMADTDLTQSTTNPMTFNTSDASKPTYEYNYFNEPRNVRVAIAGPSTSYDKSKFQDSNDFCFKSAKVEISSPLWVELQVQDGSNQFRTYQKTLASNLSALKITKTTTPNHSAPRVARTTSIGHSDPRTNRLGYFGFDFTAHSKEPDDDPGATSNAIGSSPNVQGTTFAANATFPFSLRPRMDKISNVYQRNDLYGYGVAATEGNPQFGYSAPSAIYLGLLWENTIATTKILDPDNKARMGDGGFADNDTNKVLNPMEPAASYRSITTPWPTDGRRTQGLNNSRPVQLDRAFRSPADMGYVYRDVPWRSLNFSGTDSGDAGLLDAFGIEDTASVEGRVSLNSARPEVLQAIIANSLKEEKSPSPTGVTLTDDQAKTLAKKIADYVTASNGIQNISEMVTKFSTPANLSNAGFGTGTGGESSFAVKTQREALIRALSGSTQTRTWNFLIDLVAQTGKYPPNATKLGSDFVVEGERRYWLHVAIDRYTSEVVAELLETVNE